MRFLTLTVAIILTMYATDLMAASVAAQHGAAHGMFYDVGRVLTLAVFGATLSTGAMTLIDWAKTLDPNGNTARIVEMLSQRNSMLDDMQWIQGNLPTGHRSTIRTGLPTVYWRLINQGVPPSKSQKAQVTEQAGMLEAWSELDLELARLGGNTDSLRLSEASAFIEAMNQEMAQTLIYGNSGIAGEEFTGFAPRYSAISGATNAENIIDAGGTGSDNTSIWLVAWGENTVSGIFPQGTRAGLEHEDLGEVTVEVTAGVAGNRMRALQDRYIWRAGLIVVDWRYVVRIANIDVSDLATATPPDLIALMEQADEIIPDNLGRKVFYVPRRASRYLRKQVRTNVTNGGGLTFENFAGSPVMTFDGIPVRKVDAILLTEARVV